LGGKTLSIRIIAAAAALAAILFSGKFIFQWLNRPTAGGTKPNILVLSACSLRQDMVPFMAPGNERHMPQVAKFFGRGSFIFPNAFNGLGWTALFSVTAPNLKTTWFDSVGYRLAGLFVKYHMNLIPPRHSWMVSDEEKKRGTKPDSNFEKRYKESLDIFLKDLESGDPTPYFVIAQLKYPHFPVIDRYNADSKWDQFLSPEERARVDQFLATPERFAAKLPFLLMLTNDDKLLKAHPRVRKALQQAHADGTNDAAFLGLLNSPQLLKDWTASSGYEGDLQILKKIYRANIQYFDGIVGGMLQRLESGGRLKNTVVIFAGDHGEVHMERGHLTHGTSWLDPALRIPLMIRLPDQRTSKEISYQTSFFALTEIIRGLAEGKVTEKNLPEQIEAADPGTLIARDCANRWRAYRESNQWKYAVDNATGETFLFDLTNDPEERNNLAAAQPERVSEFEQKYWEALPRYVNQMVNSCEPWVGVTKKKRED
jgi:hypothetical protein